jgi:hypothetical protein
VFFVELGGWHSSGDPESRRPDWLKSVWPAEALNCWGTGLRVQSSSSEERFREKERDSGVEMVSQRLVLCFCVISRGAWDRVEDGEVEIVEARGIALKMVI